MPCAGGSDHREPVTVADLRDGGIAKRYVHAVVIPCVLATLGALPRVHAVVHPIHIPITVIGPSPFATHHAHCCTFFLLINYALSL